MVKIKDRDIKELIGWTLRLGVLISVGIVFIGGVLFIYRHGYSTANHKVFKGVPAFLKSNSGIIDGILSLKGQAIIQAGIVLLIATPVVRVAFSAIAFILERDFLYTIISLLVLTIILASIFSGNIG
ncbi:MAG: DUF1634 domain-containing protein [Mucilaginibacter sp.]